MNLDDLSKVDNNLEYYFGEKNNIALTICTSSNFSLDALYFISSKKYLEALLESSSAFPGMLIIDNKFFSKCSEDIISQLKNRCEKEKSLVVITKNFSVSLSKISKSFYDLKVAILNSQVDGRKLSTTSIHSSAKISENVFIGENVTIGEDVVIMPGVTVLANCEIGNGTVIYPNTTIYSNTKIGKYCRIHAACVIGSDGFGYNFFEGVHLKVWHFGGVVVQDHVEMGANCTIDQGTFSPTIIGEGSKLDNQVHIAHNVKIGRGVILCGQVGIAGSSQVGDYCVFGGKSGLSDGVTLGAKSQVAGACMVTSNWEESSVLGGHPARPLNEWMRGLAFVRKNSVRKGDE